MCFKWKIVGSQQCHDQQRGYLSVASGEKSGNYRGQKISQCGEKAKSHSGVSKHCESGGDCPEGKRRFYVPVIHFPGVSVDDIAAALHHLVGGDAVARFIPGIDGTDAQAAEAQECGKSSQQCEPDPVMFFGQPQKAVIYFFHSSPDRF